MGFVLNEERQRIPSCGEERLY